MPRLRSISSVRAAVACVAALLGIGAAVAHAATSPTTVTLVGSMQSELGCPGDWQPDCAITHLTYDANSGVWKRTFTIPAGSWEYETTFDDTWSTIYGAPGGGNAVFTQPSQGSVTFYMDPVTHWITNSTARQIPVAVGSFQSELGCSGDWAPDCLRSWLQDPDNNDVYEYSTTGIPAGSYEAKVAMNESWNVNYGAGGASGGANIAFSVKKDGDPVRFSFSAATHVLAIQAGTSPAPTATPKPTPTATPKPTATPSPAAQATPQSSPAAIPSPIFTSAPVATPKPTVGPTFAVARTQTDPKLAGVRVAVSGIPAGSTVTARVFRGKTLVGKHAAKAKTGAASFKVLLNAQGKKLVRRSKQVKLTLRLAVAGAGVNSTTSLPVTLHR